MGLDSRESSGSGSRRQALGGAHRAAGERLAARPTAYGAPAGRLCGLGRDAWLLTRWCCARKTPRRWTLMIDISGIGPDDDTTRSIKPERDL